MRRVSWLGLRSKGWLASAVAVMVAMMAGVTQAAVTSFGDIEFWVGSGGNKAALVIDWADGRDALVWGYQWDGVATGEDMFRAILAADDRLYATTSTFYFGPDPSLSVQGLGYDRDDDGFGVNDPAVAFTNGHADYTALGLAADETRAASDGDDSFVEASWWTTAWNYFTYESGPSGAAADDTADWVSSWVGLTDRVLTNGSWDGFAVNTVLAEEPWLSGQTPSLAAVAAPSPDATNPGDDDEEPGQAGAVPEPATAALSLLAVGAMLAGRRRG